MMMEEASLSSFGTEENSSDTYSTSGSGRDSVPSSELGRNRSLTYALEICFYNFVTNIDLIWIRIFTAFFYCYFC
jgi:hypothetical protein